MKKFKRIICVAMAGLLVGTSLPVNAFAADNETVAANEIFTDGSEITQFDDSETGDTSTACTCVDPTCMGCCGGAGCMCGTSGGMDPMGGNILVNVSENPVYLNEGESTTIKAFLKYENGASYSSSNIGIFDESVAKYEIVDEWDHLYDPVTIDDVSYDGYLTIRITALKEGATYAALDVYSTFGMNYTATMEAYVSHVAAPIDGITLNQTNRTLKAGETYLLQLDSEPMGYPLNAAVWSAHDTSVAEVDQNGLVTAVSPGNTTITVEAEGYSAYCDVTVEADNCTIAFTTRNCTVSVDGQQVTETKVQSGSELEFAALADEHYAIETVKVNGEEVALNESGNYVLKITSNTAIEISAIQVEFPIKLEGENYIIHVENLGKAFESGTTIWKRNEQMTFSVEPKDGYRVKAVTYNDEELSELNESYTISAVGNGGILNVQMEENPSVNLKADRTTVYVNGDDAYISLVIKNLDTEPEKIQWLVDEDNILQIEAENSVAKIKGLRAGTAIVSCTVVINGSEYVATCKISVEEPLELTGVELIAGFKFDYFTYDGKAKEPPLPQLALGNEILNEGIDYVVSYKNNVNAGKATLIVTGQGNYAGDAKFNFDINPREITANDITVEANVKLFGSSNKPTVQVKDGNTSLAENVDFAVGTPLKIDDKTMRVTVTGINNYCGERTVDYNFSTDGTIAIGTYLQITVDGKNVSADGTVTEAKTIVPWNKEAHDVAVTICLNGVQQVENKNYVVEYTRQGKPTEDFTSKGIIGIHVKGITFDSDVIYYCGIGVSKDNIMIDLKETSYRYTGKPVVPDIEIYHDGVLLVRGVDYIIDSASTEVSDKATATITYIGDYEDLGTQTIEFKIVPAQTESIALNQQSVELAPGEKMSLKAEIKPDEMADQKLIWTTDNEQVAVVDKGEVTAVAPGVATITVQTEDGKKSQCIVTVKTSVQWSFNDGLLTISGVGEMEDYRTNGKQPWYSNMAKIKKVIIEDGITSISMRAFYGASCLTEISVPASVKEIGLGAFFRCNALLTINYDGTLDEWQSIDIEPSNESIINSVALKCKDSLSGTCGKDVKWVLNSNTLTISGTGKMNNYGQNGKQPWFAEMGDIQKVVIEEGITSVGARAFYGANALTNVEFPATLNEIGLGAFFRCYHLENIIYPENYEMWISISIDSSNDAYIGKAIITTADMIAGGCGTTAKWNYANGVLKVFGTGAMDNYNQNGKQPWYDVIPNITKFVIEDGITTVGRRVLYGARNLAEIEIPDSVESIELAAFYRCYGIKNIKFSGTGDSWINIQKDSSNDSYIRTATVVATDMMLGGCGTSVNWKFSGNTLTITGTGAMTNYNQNGQQPWFSTMGQIRNVIVEEGITSLGKRALYGASTMKAIQLPSTIKSIELGAFLRCDKMQTISYNGSYLEWNKISVDLTNKNYIDRAIVQTSDSQNGICGSNLTWSFRDGILTISGTGKMSDYRSYGQEPWVSLMDSIQEIVIEEGVSTIGARAFHSATNLKKITIPSSVTSIGICGLYQIKTLSDVNYLGTKSQWNQIDIDQYSQAVLNNAKMTYKEATDWNISDGVLTITGTGPMENYSQNGKQPWYDKMTEISSVVIEEGITTIGNRAFYGAKNMVAISIPSTMEKIGLGAFLGCGTLKNIDYNDSLSSWRKIDINSSGNMVLDNAKINVKSVNGTLGTNIEWELYNNVLTLTGEGKVTGFKSGGSQPWYQYRTTIKEVVISEGITDIGSRVFHSSVPVMVKLHLPSTLKKIETGAFYQANRLAYVYYNGSKEDWANVSIDSNSAIYINKAEFVTKD